MGTAAPYFTMVTCMGLVPFFVVKAITSQHYAKDLFWIAACLLSAAGFGALGNFIMVVT